MNVKNSAKVVSILGVVAALAIPSVGQAQVPTITGEPTIVAPDLLSWPQDFPQETPYLTEPTANRLNDFHGEFSNCDIVLSTAGNYHMALRELWQVYLHTYVDDLDIQTWFYTTSPPISPQQIPAGVVQFGNMNARCTPQVAVGPGGIMTKLIDANLVEGTPVKIVKNYGNVILVRKGNPKNIKGVWDLGRSDVTLVTPNPTLEGGSFGNFSGTIYNIAAAEEANGDNPRGLTAEALFNSIFNGGDPIDCRRNDDRRHRRHRYRHHNRRCKRAKTPWVAGKRIMHREQPWAVYSGKADAGVIFYHLALYFTRSFPDKFEIVPLGGTAENPEPVEGNRIGVMQAVRVKGNWNAKQLEARERLMDALSSQDFADILPQHGLRLP